MTFRREGSTVSGASRRQRRLHAVPLVVAAALVAPFLIAGPAQALPPGPGGIAPTPSTATGASVAAPTVIGPIANTSPLGDAAHGYPFLASDYDLAGNGYVEEEYFISGTATRYATYRDEHGHGPEFGAPVQDSDRRTPADVG